MSTPRRLCLLLLLLASTSCHARPKASSGGLNKDSGERHSEERINLHHSLKEVHYAASKMVKDVHGYIHQSISSMANKQLDIISRPLVKVMAPIFYFKDRLVSMRRGTRKPSQQEDISAWCPSCLDNDTFDRPDPSVVTKSPLKVPCFEHDPDCYDTNLPNYSEEEASTSRQPSKQSTSSETPEHQRSDDIPVPPDTDIVFPDYLEKQKKSLDTNTNDRDDKFPAMEIDVRFGYLQAPLLSNLTQLGLSRKQNQGRNVVSSF